jgi:hypothetical protein
MDKVQHGSRIAKKGFQNEKDIADKFNNWKKDEDAQIWLQIMNYSLMNIESVFAVTVYGHKTDVQVQVSIKLKEVLDVQNLQVKLVSNKRGFNQIDKRWVDSYKQLWNIPDNICLLLKSFCGESTPTIKMTRDQKRRRMFIDEFTQPDQQSILDWVIQNKVLIVNDLLKGRGTLAAEWMLVAQKINSSTRWTLKPMNYCLNFFGNGDIAITSRGNLKIGKITMQRKGGDGGRNTANMLQFKIDPTALFEA